MQAPEHATPAPAVVQFRLAALWQARGRFERAASGYASAISLQPDYLPAYLELGQLLRGRGELAAELALYRRGQQALPHEPRFAQKIAELTALLDRPDEPAAIAPAPGERHVVLYSDCSGTGGAEQCNHALLLSLAAQGYRVTCVQPWASNPLIAAREQHGIAHAWIAPDDLYDPGRSTLSSSGDPARLLADLKPDLLIFADGSPFSNLHAKEAAADLGIPYLTIVHCVSPAWADQFASYLDRLAATYRRAAAVIAVAEANLRLLRERFALPADVGEVIHNGRPPRFFAPPDPTQREQTRHALGASADTVIVLTVAALELRKGHQYLLRAIKQLRCTPLWPRLRFVWAGAGSLEPQIRAVLDQIGASDQVRLVGEVEDVLPLLDAADIFALTSQFEGMPLSIMEAMARSLPVAATAVSGVPAELGDTGRLLSDPARDPAATVRDLLATLELWAADASLRRASGQRCRRRAEELFADNLMLARYHELIAAALGARV